MVPIDFRKREETEGKSNLVPVSSGILVRNRVWGPVCCVSPTVGSLLHYVTSVEVPTEPPEGPDSTSSVVLNGPSTTGQPLKDPRARVSRSGRRGPKLVLVLTRWVSRSLVQTFLKTDGVRGPFL